MSENESSTLGASTRKPPMLPWTCRVHVVTGETLEIVIDRLDLPGRPKYSYQIKQLRDRADSLPFIGRDIFVVDGGIVRGCEINEHAISNLVAEAEAWIVSDAQLRTHALPARTERGAPVRAPGKTARDRAKHKDDSRRTNNPALSQRARGK